MDQCVRVLNDSLANFDARFTADHKDIMAGVALLLGALVRQRILWQLTGALNYSKTTELKTFVATTGSI